MKTALEYTVHDYTVHDYSKSSKDQQKIHEDTFGNTM